jgi:hypothetical protein
MTESWRRGLRTVNETAAVVQFLDDSFYRAQ